MGWSDVSDKHLRKYLRDAIYCQDNEEKEYLKGIIKEEFPMLNESAIEVSIRQCCGKTNIPMPTNLFIVLIKRKLEVFK